MHHNDNIGVRRLEFSTEFQNFGAKYGPDHASSVKIPHKWSSDQIHFKQELYKYHTL